MILHEARLFVARFEKGDYTPEEYATFLEWLEKASLEELEGIADEHEAFFEQWSLPVKGPSSEWIDRLEQKLDMVEKLEHATPVRSIHRARLVKRIVGVAAAALVVSVGSYLLLNRQAGQTTGSNNQTAVNFHTDVVQPGGQQQQFVLPDGSKVWLNAASSLEYPVSFAGSERRVKLSGEGYFDVAANAAAPFRVAVSGMLIEVLGTHFNVQSYSGESLSRATLVEGKIKVIRGTQEVFLQPGQRATVSSLASDLTSAVNVESSVDLLAVKSWLNGYLKFKDDDLRTVIRQVGRCYNLEVEFEQGVPERRFTGEFSRKQSITEIFEQLERFQIHCKLENGKKIVVMH